MGTWSERRLIEKIRQASQVTAEGLLTAIGDDCCEVTANGSWLISTDTLVDRVHFDRSFHPPHLLGRKTIAVNLSDIAAMGARPRFVQLSLCLPENLDWGWISSYLDGVFEILREYDTVLVGGDTVKGRDLVVSVTVFGEPTTKGAIYRSGAKEGDTVWVSGPIGSAGCGLALLVHEKNHPGKLDLSTFQNLLDAHLNPVPCIDLGIGLAQSEMLTAMQDISDGLATDLAHICQASGVSAHIDADRLPYLPELKTAAMVLGLNRQDLMLRAGEDYQLVFTVAQGREQAFSCFTEKYEWELTRIGTIHSGEGVFLQKEGGIEEITFQGYEH
ncbi:MAG: thiamine-phosphate kinase [Desulfocapsa sp.]|nr:thiamine-phosphate kinase [Desulfocapsa sp.]